VKLAEAAGDELLVTQTLQLSAEVASDNGDWQALGSIRAKAATVEHSSTQPETVAVSRVTQGYCLLVAGDVAMARLQFDDCLDSLRRLSLNKELRQALNGLGMAHYCLGSAKDAISAFERAMSVAKSIGDTAALATMSSNLGAVREDLGDFQQAENCYQRALELEAKASNPRRAAEVHMNLASLRLITRDTQDALRCLSIAKVNAAESQLWWLQTDVLLAEADYHIAGGTPETAWPLVEEAQAVTRGRVYLFSNRGKYERLRIHHLWFTQGFAAVQRLCQTENLRDRCLLKSGFLEVQALVDWIRQRECVGERSAGTALDELAGLELHGTIARLSMLGVGNVPRMGT
jgi:tetratricopeptide (TPR) repeat protein